MTKVWKHNPFPGNYVLEGKDFAISYNPSPGVGLSFFISDGGGAETALCKGDSYYILNGDFRDQYEELVPQGFEACLKFFREHEVEAGSSWTSPSVREGKKG